MNPLPIPAKRRGAGRDGRPGYGGAGLAVAACLLAGACSFGPFRQRRVNAAPAAASAHPRIRSTPAVAVAGPARSYEVARLAERALGPFVAQGPDGGLLAWIARSKKGEGQDLFVVPVAADGAPLRPPRTVARVPDEATSLVIEPAGASHGGWFIAWSSLLDRGESLTVLGLTAEGAARGTAADVRRTDDHIKWEQILPTKHGALCVWAEETPAGDANILSAPIDMEGTLGSVPERIARGVDGWQAVATGDGAALALVAIGAVGDRPPAGTLTWQRLDADGHPEGGGVVVSAKGTVSSDVEVVLGPEGWLMAWTDRTGEDPRVMLAAVDAGGHVRGPVEAMNAVGGSSVVALAAGSRGIALAWEEPHDRARSTRELHLARVDGKDLSAAPVSSVEIASGPRPELVATDSGFALLAPARACPADADAPCRGAIVPTFMRLTDRFDVAQAEPLFVGDDAKPAAVGWGLRCVQAERCFAFAAPGVTPTPIYAVDLEARRSPYAAPLPPPQRPDAPRATGIETIASGKEYDDLAAVRVGGATFVATVTSALDDTDQPSQPSASKIALRGVDGDGRLLAPVRQLTSAALPAGGIALATDAAAADPHVAAVWVADDGGAPTLHVALLDRTGQPLREAHLGGEDHDAGSVAVAWTGQGWMVAWVDDRDGNGDVYAATLDRDLGHPSPEHRVRKAAGDASDVALAVGDGVAWIAWSDPRESPRDGVSDIFASALRLEDASPAGDVVRVLPTALHSRSPSLVALSDGGAMVAWIEDAPTGVDAPGGAMVARLDRKAHVVGVPRELPLERRPVQIALERGPGGVRAAVARASADGVAVDALRLAADGSSLGPPSTLLELDAPASFDVALALAGNAIVFSDVGDSPATRRVRRASIAWNSPP